MHDHLSFTIYSQVSVWVSPVYNFRQVWTCRAHRSTYTVASHSVSCFPLIHV